MQTTDTLQYKRYTCQVFYYNVKDCLSGRVVGVGEIPNVRGQTLAEIKALAMYAMGQKMLLSQVIQQALNEFIKNHDIEIPNREEN